MDAKESKPDPAPRLPAGTNRGELIARSGSGGKERRWEKEEREKIVGEKRGTPS